MSRKDKPGLGRHQRIKARPSKELEVNGVGRLCTSLLSLLKSYREEESFDLFPEVQDSRTRSDPWETLFLKELSVNNVTVRVASEQQTAS